MMAGNKGKYLKSAPPKKKAFRRKAPTALICVILILALAAGGTLAYVITKTNQVQNTFVATSVTSRVNTGNDGSFDVTNTGDVDAYIRAAIAVNWMNTNGDVRGLDPNAADYYLNINTTDWWQDTSTGYYYYMHSVDPLATTSDLVTSFGLTQNAKVPAGYELSVEVVAEAIQADGDKDTNNMPAYQDAWDVQIPGL